MSGSSTGGRRGTKIRLPSVSLPRIARVPKNPPGWNTSEVAIRTRGLPGASDMKSQEPAGDPPEDWTGTRPEWAIWWALERLGYSAEDDFVYQAKLPGVGSSYYSTVDFLIHSVNIGIEVQGRYWHYGVGSDKEYHDTMRATLFAAQGITIIFIDEQDCLDDPMYYVQEALEGNDHSDIGRVY